jgi:hypothetical protein
MSEPNRPLIAWRWSSSLASHLSFPSKGIVLRLPLGGSSRGTLLDRFFRLVFVVGNLPVLFQPASRPDNGACKEPGQLSPCRHPTSL